jgi:hypothetical protein
MQIQGWPKPSNLHRALSTITMQGALGRASTGAGLKWRWSNGWDIVFGGFFRRNGADRGRGELGNERGASKFVGKRTLQIDQQRERTAWDKLNSICVKPTIATLVPQFNTAIVSGWTVIRFYWKLLETTAAVHDSFLSFHSYIYRKRKKHSSHSIIFIYRFFFIDSSIDRYNLET